MGMDIMDERHEDYSSSSSSRMKKKCKKRLRFSINDNMDVLIEILKRLDEKSMGVAGCVCRLWLALTRNDALWENLCFRQLSPPPEGVRTVVAALGGYRRLYTLCVKPVLSRLGRDMWTTHEVDLSLSLFCVDYYERLFLTGAGRITDNPPSSLIFLCGKAG